MKLLKKQIKYCDKDCPFYIDGIDKVCGKTGEVIFYDSELWERVEVSDGLPGFRRRKIEHVYRDNLFPITPLNSCPLPDLEQNIGVQVGAVALVCKEGKLLAGIRIGDRTMSGDYALPGGKMDACEKDPSETVKREGKEEVGIKIKNPKLIGTIDEPFPDRGVFYYVFYYLITEWEGDIVNMEPEKCAGWEWVNPKELPSNFSPFARKIVEKHIDEILSVK